MKKLLLIMLMLCLTSCGFKLRGAMPLAPPLQRIYLETPDPYGPLTSCLRQFFKMSGVTLVENRAEASSVLTILSENKSDQLLGINGSGQTRQYNLVLTVTFQISNTNNRVLVASQTLSESRALTIINDQILASSNEAMSLYGQMRQAIAYDMMSRLSSEEITTQITSATQPLASPIQPPVHVKKKKSHKKSARAVAPS